MWIHAQVIQLLLQIETKKYKKSGARKRIGGWNCLWNEKDEGQVTDVQLCEEQSS